MSQENENRESNSTLEYPIEKRTNGEAIFAACVDGLTGFPQAIEAVYPQTEVQQCIIHQNNNSTKFVLYKDIKKLMADLKRVYAALTKETALNELELLKDKWISSTPKSRNPGMITGRPCPHISNIQKRSGA